MHSATKLPDRIGVRVVLGLAWPVMISMLSHTAMSLIDTIFVGSLGTAPLAGIGVAVPLTFLLLGFGMGLQGGVRVNVAQRVGAEDHEVARRLAWQALWVAAAMGGIVLFAVPFTHLLIALQGATGEVADHAGDYLSVRLLAAPTLFAQIGLSGWFQGRGDTRSPMVATLLGNGLNIVLDPLLIFGMDWGVGGAAAATNIAEAVGVAFLVLRALPALRSTSFAPDRELLRAIWKLGGPMGAQRVLDVLGFVVFIGVLAAHGEIDLAAHVIAIRIVSVSFLPGHAISEAAGVLVGQAVGARKPHLAREAWWSSVGVGIGIMGACAVLFISAPTPLIAVFQPEPSVAHVAVSLLMVAALFQVIDAIAMVTYGALSGAGDTRFLMAASVGVMWLVNIPLAYVLTLHLGLGAVGAWLSLTCEITALAVILALRVRGATWLSHLVPEAVPAG